MIFDGFSHQLPDTDPEETQEWVDSLASVIDAKGRPRATYLMMKLLEKARENQVGFPASVSSPYINTIPPEQEPWFPGDEYMERRIRAFIRWNAAVMVTRANILSDGIGGHLATYASSASLYEVGFNHFFRGKADGNFGDQVFIQGHASPGIYARAYLEGRISETQLDNFRQEVAGNGLSSYPHPRLMPDLWQFPTVSMGLGPITAIYQARFNKYIEHRRIADTSSSRVWCFVGDGEVDEPETLGALSLASREKLDHLIFVVNCNLQRLDGPVRGNGKIIQELEAVFRGAGWNVIKVIWGRGWDKLLAQDTDGVLLNRMNTTVDGDFQKYATESGEYIREHFFGPDPRLRKMVEHMTDKELEDLPRGGHDYRKLYAAYKAATENVGAPTVILAKTIKGWTLGPEIEARNATHQIKKMNKAQLLKLRDRLRLKDEIPEELLDNKLPPYYRPKEGSAEFEYMISRRTSLGGPVPARVVRSKPLEPPKMETISEFLLGSAKLPVSTTMVFAKMLRNLVRDPSVGRRIVPIVPDEARTFGLDALFKEVKIYSSQGQRYTPVDAGLLLSYAESTDGQILEEGITEPGSMASFTAAGTSYANFGQPMVPMYIFYSMFGFQRTGDLIWAASDARAKGFLLAATAGRTTLLGEGLQHADGHSHVLASTVPSIMAYDPSFAYELGILIRHGFEDMYGENARDCIYYITLYNENYVQPALPEGSTLEEIQDGVIKGIYKWLEPPTVSSVEIPRKATILFSGPTWHLAQQAQEILANDYNVAATLYSVTSYKGLREDGLETERWNRLNPTSTPKTPYVTQILSQGEGPVVAVTDFMKIVPDQIARFVPREVFIPLGTDGFGRSDTREALRRHFEIDAAHIVVSVLYGLMSSGVAKPEEVQDAINSLGIDPNAVDPMRANV